MATLDRIQIDPDFYTTERRERPSEAELLFKRCSEFVEHMIRQSVAHEVARQQVVSRLAGDMLGQNAMEMTCALRMLAGADRALGEAVARILAAANGIDLPIEHPSEQEELEALRRLEGAAPGRIMRAMGLSQADLGKLDDEPKVTLDAATRAFLDRCGVKKGQL